MSGPSANPLSRARIRELLAAVGSAPVPEPVVPHVREYDWRDPHYFNEDHLNRLAAIMSHAAALIGGCFAHFYSREFQVTPRSITQHFADDLRDSMEVDDAYCLTFGPANRPPCGFLTVEGKSAARWVTRLLGDSESDGQTKRNMSPLEHSLLSDLMVAVLEAFLTPIRSDCPLRPAGEIGEGQPTIQFERTEAICRIAFQVKQADGGEESDVLFLLPCNRLAPLVGKTAEGGPQIPVQELSQALMEHLQQMPVTITARLASATLSFEEIADLESGDVLLLDKRIEGTLELMIDGRIVFRGRPVRSDGRQAVLITESAHANAHETPNHAAKG